MGKTGVRAAAVAALLALALSLPVTVRSANGSENRVVCYYTNWSVYRPGTAKFSPQNINPYLCTHLIYAFGGFTKENALKPFDKYQDIEKGGYAKFTGLKTYNKALKTLLAIGGWNEGSSRFSPMVASPERRKELIKNAIKFLRQNHFDGLDLDWEYPSFRDGGKARDRENYAQLVQELREEFDRESQKTGRPRLLLTMAVPAGLEYIDKGYDIPKLNRYLDWMNILSYDYHSAFEPAANHHSPLYSLEESEDDEYNYDSDLNVDATVKHYLKAGADRDKLVLGIPTYGRSYTLFNPDANEIGAPADGPGDMGEATRENGYLAYYEICESVKNGDWKVVQPNPRAMGPYAYKGNQWVGYDDELIVKRKAEYVAQMGLGGIMFWALDNDDFRGVCHGKSYPLIEAAKEALLSAATDNLVDKKAIVPGRTRSRTTSTTRSTPVRNSGGRQGVAEEDVTKPSRRRKPIRAGNKDGKNSEQRTRTGTRRRPRPTTAATTPTTTSVLTQRTSTTPEPPTTPDPGSDFKCEDEGFFPHPRDCKKYFWCLSSGPSELGIIAHQFTCPSGLYFNKAADSCDYTQNVLCNKKLKKTTSTTTSTTAEPSTTSTTTTTASPVFNTRRPPPKITAATSKTTYVYTTTTEAPEYDEEYEYEDEDLGNDKDEEIDSEEDPRVIKELIDLIKKVGGVEQLEKFLQLQEEGTATSKSDFTTPATISKSLYERVLSQSGGTTNSFLNTLANRNRGKPQYTTISRVRPQAPADEEKDVEEETSQSTARETATKAGAPEYVTIRRQRLGTTTSAPTELEYVTLRRQPNRQSQEETTTSKYTTIIRRRPTTESADLEANEENKEKPTGGITEESSEKQEDKEILAVSVQLPSVEGSPTTLSAEGVSIAREPSTPTVSAITEKSTPRLFRPRPFTTSRPIKTPTTTTEPTKTTRKVSVVGNRGNSRFTVPAQIARPTDSPYYDQEEYDEDDEDPDVIRSYRPQEIADLSSLTSADISFGGARDAATRRRRPTTTTTTTSTTIATEKPSLGFKPNARIPFVRKPLLSTSENTPIIRPRFGRPTTTERISKQKTEENLEQPSRLYQTVVRSKYGVSGDATQFENEVTETILLEDSTGFDTDNDYKTAEPEITTEEPTIRPRRILNRITTAEPEITNEEQTLRPRRILVRTTTAKPETTEPQTLRTRRINRITTTPIPQTNNVDESTTKRNIKRIRIFKINNRDESEEIKLSESNRSDTTRIGVNSVQGGDANKQRKRKKIIRRIRPGNSRNESEENKNVNRIVIGTRNGRFQLQENENSEKEFRTNPTPEQQTTTDAATSAADYEELDEPTTFDSSYVAESETTTTSVEEETKLSNDVFPDETTTEDFTTITTTTTTTTSKPRSTAPSLIGRSRPAYRPRGKTPTTPDFRSTTPISRNRYRFRSTTTSTTAELPLRTTSTTTQIHLPVTEALLSEDITTETAADQQEIDSSITTTENVQDVTTYSPTTLQEDPTTIGSTDAVTESGVTIIPDSTDSILTDTISEEQQDERNTEKPIEEASEKTESENVTKVTEPEEIENKPGLASADSVPDDAIGTDNSEITEKSAYEVTEESSTSTTARTTIRNNKFRPRLNLTQNRLQQQISTSTEEAKIRNRFISNRPTNQRNRFSVRGENTPTTPRAVIETSTRQSYRKFAPQGRKLEKLNEEADYVTDDIETDEQIDSDVPVNDVNENVDQSDESGNIKRPNQPPSGKISRNFPRKFSNKPFYATTTAAPSTTTISSELLNARNKQLFSNPRKMNIPHKNAEEPPTSLPEITTTEETSTSTDQLSTLHHVFAEIEPVTESGSTDSTTVETETSTDVPLQSTTLLTQPLERLVEVNRIVQVSLKEEKTKKNHSGFVASELTKHQVFNAKSVKVGAINRLTVINVVDGSGSANHATLEDILTGRKIFTSSKSNVTSDEMSTTTPTDTETKLNILNNTLEIIEADKKFEIFSKSNVVDYSHRVNDPIASAVPKESAAPVIETAGGVGTVETADKVNNVEEDIFESANSGRVRVRIVGKEPQFAPIVSDSQESATLKAVVVEVAHKQDEIKIAPIKVSIGA